jgi:hypothetical protein
MLAADVLMQDGMMIMIDGCGLRINSMCCSLSNLKVREDAWRGLCR